MSPREMLVSGHRFAIGVGLFLLGFAAPAFIPVVTASQLSSGWKARVSDADRLKAQIEAFSESLTALITLPFAYVGEWSWNIAWLSYIPIAVFLRKRDAR